LHEVKCDGWRVQLHKRDDAITIFTKNGHDYTRRFPSIACVVAALPARSCIIDGDLTACGDHGAPDFYALHFCGSQMLCAWTFDLLELNGRDARELLLIEHKVRLERLISKPDDDRLRFSECFDDPDKLLDAANLLRLEGIATKRRTEAYRSVNASQRIKVKFPACRTRNRPSRARVH